MKALRFSAIALAMTIQPVAAHETWLLPSDVSPTAGDSISFYMTSGMSFPANGSAITMDRIVEQGLSGGGNDRALAPAKERSEGALSLSGKVEAGLNCAYVRLSPRILQIDTDDEVQHYLEEIGAPPSVYAHWDVIRSSEVWRESYSKLARTYVQAAGEASGESCLESTSDGRFEIQPLSDPTTLDVDDELSVQVLFDGEPLEGQAIGIVREGDAPNSLMRSDNSGQVSLMVNGWGRYLVYATNLRPAAGDDFNWESDFATFTFYVSKP